ncbi:MAG: hypothetical protein ACTSXJ_03115 [Candidatus Baldrarchaeia archaeon]
MVRLEDVRRVKEQALKFILPTKEEIEEQNRVIDRLKSHLIKTLEEKGYEFVGVEAHGSTGIKQTQLRGASDIDIFVEFPPTAYSHIFKMSRRKRAEEIRRIFGRIVEDCFKEAAIRAGCSDIKIAYAEHPYLSARYGRFDIDIVGCFYITREALMSCGPITAVDRTPHHSRFIKDALNDAQRNDVRLLKAFFIANHAYGDKSAVGRCGFTGYSAEVLVYHYGSFENVLLNFDQLAQKPIDFFNRPPAQLKSNPRFKDDFLIIIDPVDPNRNLAASIDRRAYLHIRRMIKEFLENPRVDYFLRKPIEPLSADEHRRFRKNTIVVEFRCKSDVHYVIVRDKLYRLASYMTKILEREETGEKRFGKVIFEIYFENGDIYAVAFFIEKPKIPDTFIRRGPPVWAKEHVKEFLRKHPDAYADRGFYWTRVKRKYTTALSLVKSLLSVEGLERFSLRDVDIISISKTGTTTVGRKALAVLVRFILPIEFSSS